MPFEKRQKLFHNPNLPSTAHEPAGPASEISSAQTRASRRRVVLRTCLTATLIIGSLFTMTTVLLAYVCAVHQCQFSAHSLHSTAPLGKVLTITQITSQIYSVSIPIIMGLFSYLLSVKWLRSSGIKGGPNRPTSMQLGLLMTMCNGADIRSLLSSVKFMALKKKSPIEGEKVTPTPMLQQSVFVLGSLLTISYISTGADAWLHASSTSIIIPSNSHYDSSILTEFGREINSTMCQEASSFVADDYAIPSCGILSDGSGGNGNKLAEGIRVLSNSSVLHQVVFTDDQTAILIPPTLPSNITYEAQTVGVKTQCTTITSQCVYEVDDDGLLSTYGPNAYLNLNCSKGGIKYQNASTPGNSPLCALDSHGICTEGMDIPSNPFSAAEVATSFAYLNPGQPIDQFVGNTGWFVHGNTGAWNVVLCNVTALDVIYTYASLRFLLHSAVPKSVNDSQHMMAGGFYGRTTAISQAVDGAGLDSGSTYEQVYAIELSRQMLARGAFLYRPKGIIKIQSENNIVGSKLQLEPLVLFIAAILLFASQIIWITLQIVFAAWNVQFVGLAALYLSNPLTVVQSLYGRRDPELTWDDNVIKRFRTETNVDRLRVGPVYNEFGSVFTVIRG